MSNVPPEGWFPADGYRNEYNLTMSNVPPEGWFPVDGHRNQYNLNIRILATAVLSLIFVICLVVILHLYVRCILRRHLVGRRNAVTLLRFSVTTTHHDPPMAAGLDPSTIAALPTFAYNSKGDSTECAVCLSAVEDGEMVRLLPNCKHLFHVGCIDMWLNSHPTCPVCRAAAEPQAVASMVVVSEQREELCEGCDQGASASGSKEGDSSLRLSSSFQKMLVMDRSGRRAPGDGMRDLERQ